MKNFKRLLSTLIAFIAIAMLNPTGANAEWRQNSTGWWYTEGNSYATEWRFIDGNWYYFYSDGYMATNAIIDGYYLNENGAWSNDSEYNITIINAQEMVKQYLSNNGKYIPQIVEVDHVEGNSWVLHCYDVITYPGEGSHTATSGWYYVDRDNGNIRSMF
ncbi:MAG: hypothetical protein LLF98_06425 [Clostridium sp.]|uniref:hypothetical protein n=1 Tax=Clostridium sp. TaxID=1506 RepID=UPI0025C629B0|nr:hypothetical protein [Clostridium sp.]MCE5220901.1 hypothetical protein [Clostridium sp.]